MRPFSFFNRKEGIRILGLIQGDVNDPLSRSGVNYRLYKELAQLASVVKVIDVEPKGARRYGVALRTFHFNKEKWARRFYENPLMFSARTQLASAKMAEATEPYDVILQDGAMWLPGRNTDDKPLITYHDSNVILGSSGGSLAQGSHYHGKRLREAVSLEKMVYERASRILTFSNWVRISMIRDFHLPEYKVKVARPGVNFEIPRNLDKRYDEPMILFVGRNFERKGGPVLLEAFRLVRKTIKNATLVIIGCHPPVNEDGVTLKGLIPREREKELKALYQAASVFALPSLFEPFGLVFLEAMAYKLPCVGTNVCAMPEIIGDGECGFVVTPGDHAQLADRLIALLRNPKLMSSMGKKGYRRVKEEYTWNNFARIIAAQCRQVT